MSKFKKVLSQLLVVAMTAGITISGTLAYLTSEDSDVNVMTLGNVKIEQHEYERVVDENGNWIADSVNTATFGAGTYIPDLMQEFTQGKVALPAVYQDGTLKWDDRNGSQTSENTAEAHQQPWGQVGAPGSNQLFDSSVKNVIDKFVFVENTGKTDAYYRTIVAVECPVGLNPELIHINDTGNTRFTKTGAFYATIDGVQYVLYEYIYNPVLTPGEVSRPSFLQVFLDPAATNEDCALFGDTWEILVVSQAVQADGFTDAATALDTAFGDITTGNHPWIDGVAIPVGVSTETELSAALAEGVDVYLEKDIATTNFVTVTGTLNGNGNTIDADAIADTAYGWTDKAVVLNGGTLENATIINAFYAVGSATTSEDIYIKNVTIDKSTYAINGNGTGSNSVYVSDSTINGWCSYSNVELFSFTDCYLATGDSYLGYLVVYGDTEFTNCTFEEFWMCGRMQNGVVQAAGDTVTFNNCYYVTKEGTEKVTADNFRTLFLAENDEKDFGYLAQSTIVIDGVTVNWN